MAPSMNFLRENNFFSYVIRCLNQGMHGFIACSIYLCNLSFHYLLSVLHCSCQAPMLSVLLIVLKGWCSNVTKVDLPSFYLQILHWITLHVAKSIHSNLVYYALFHWLTRISLGVKLGWGVQPLDESEV